MLGKNFLIGGAATALLVWRLVDPKGSYAVLYDLSHQAAGYVSGYEVLTRFVSLVLLDQFNGLMLGVAMTALLYMMLSSLRRAASWPRRLRAKKQFPLSRYSLPGRVARVN